MLLSSSRNTSVYPSYLEIKELLLARGFMVYSEHERSELVWLVKQSETYENELVFAHVHGPRTSYFSLLKEHVAKMCTFLGLTVTKDFEPKTDNLITLSDIEKGIYYFDQHRHETNYKHFLDEIEHYKGDFTYRDDTRRFAQGIYVNDGTGGLLISTYWGSHEYFEIQRENFVLLAPLMGIELAEKPFKLKVYYADPQGLREAGTQPLDINDILDCSEGLNYATFLQYHNDSEGRFIGDSNEYVISLHIALSEPDFQVYVERVTRSLETKGFVPLRYEYETLTPEFVPHS